MMETSAFRWARVDNQQLAWHLRRNCSVTPRQLGAFYVSICAVSLIIGGFFWLRGARPVLGFAGLEVLALSAALLSYARHAGDGETVSLGDGVLVVERDCAGRRERVEFGSAHVRIALRDCRHGLIALSAHGKRVEIGRHVRPEWRPLLAAELQRALRASGSVGAPEMN